MKTPTLLVLSILAAPAAAVAQSSISGTAEITAAESTNTTDSQASANGSFWQNYALGFHSSLWDPRILKYDTEVMYRTNRLSASGTDLADQRGQQDDLGFRVGAFALSSGSFPFYFQASRVFGGSSGELAMANPLRGSVGVAGGDATSFETENRDMTMGGQMNVPGLPRAEIAYRRGNAIVTGGTERSETRNEDLSANVLRETSRTRQALRYQRNAYDYALTQVYSQHVDNLDYDFTANLRSHLQFTARAGQRGALTRSILLAPVDPGDKPYEPPPSDGRTDTQYVTGGMSYEPNSRVAARLNATWDRQQTELAGTDSGLVTGSLHLEVLRGLSVNAAGTGGRRGQLIDEERVRVATASGVAGVSYTGGPRWLTGTLSANAGQGRNQTPEGERGSTRSWAREASLASAIGWLGLGAGYEQVQSRDQILDYGNYDSERTRASVNLQSARMSLTSSAERLHTRRGQGLTLALNDQQTYSVTLAGRLWREVLVTGTGGGFSTTYQSAVGRGLDQSLFWSLGAQAAFRRTLRVTGWIRNENTEATGTRFTQKGLNALARVEQRLRAVSLALEYRHTNNLLQYGEAPRPSLYRGHQVRVTVTRQFGFKV